MPAVYGSTVYRWKPGFNSSKGDGFIYQRAQSLKQYQVAIKRVCTVLGAAVPAVVYRCDSLTQKKGQITIKVICPIYCIGMRQMCRRICFRYEDGCY
jgi:hypothetical protein